MNYSTNIYFIALQRSPLLIPIVVSFLYLVYAVAGIFYVPSHLMLLQMIPNPWERFYAFTSVNSLHGFIFWLCLMAFLYQLLHGEYKSGMYRLFYYAQGHLRAAYWRLSLYTIVIWTLVAILQAVLAIGSSFVYAAQFQKPATYMMGVWDFENSASLWDNAAVYFFKMWLYNVITILSTVWLFMRLKQWGFIAFLIPLVPVVHFFFGYGFMTKNNRLWASVYDWRDLLILPPEDYYFGGICVFWLVFLYLDFRFFSRFIAR